MIYSKRVDVWSVGIRQLISMKAPKIGQPVVQINSHPTLVIPDGVLAV